MGSLYEEGEEREGSRIPKITKNQEKQHLKNKVLCLIVDVLLMSMSSIPVLIEGILNLKQTKIQKEQKHVPTGGRLASYTDILMACHAIFPP